MIKFWLEVSNDEQKRRFEARIEDPLRQWKLSPMDLPSRTRWYDYSRARDLMLKTTDTRTAPWYILRSDDKRAARLNAIAHLLSLIPHKKLPEPKVHASETFIKGCLRRRRLYCAPAVRAGALLKESTGRRAICPWRR